MSEEALKFVPDDLSLGTQLFFLALTEMQLDKLASASLYLDKCALTHWTDAKRNRFLYLYAGGKLLQRQGQHLAAATKFTEAAALSPDNAYCYFKRAWCYKVRTRYIMLRFATLITLLLCFRLLATLFGRGRTSSAPRPCGRWTRTSRWTTGAYRGCSTWSSVRSQTSWSHSCHSCPCRDWHPSEGDEQQKAAGISCACCVVIVQTHQVLRFMILEEKLVQRTFSQIK